MSRYANQNRYLAATIRALDEAIAELRARPRLLSGSAPARIDPAPHNAEIRPDGTRADRESDAADAKDR